MGAKTNSLNGVSVVNGAIDREAHPRFWIAAYTRPKSEKKTAKEISNYGYETFVPVQKQLRQWSDRKKIIDVVVIPNIIFVNLGKEDITTIQRHLLIINLLKFPGEKDVAQIPEDNILHLKFLTGQTDIPIIYDPQSFHVDADVRITRGPLAGIIGKVLDTLDGTSEILVNLGILGGAHLRIKKIELELL